MHTPSPTIKHLVWHNLIHPAVIAAIVALALWKGNAPKDAGD